MYAIFEHLGNFYQAFRVMQDSGIWLYNVEQYAEYYFARLINNARQK